MFGDDGLTLIFGSFGVGLVKKKLIFGKVLESIDGIWFRKDNILIAESIVEYDFVDYSLLRGSDDFGLEGVVFLLKLSANTKIVYICIK